MHQCIDTAITSGLLYVHILHGMVSNLVVSCMMPLLLTCYLAAHISKLQNCEVSDEREGHNAKHPRHKESYLNHLLLQHEVSLSPQPSQAAWCVAA